MLKATLCTLALAAALLTSIPAVSQTASDVVFDHNVAMKTRDGVALRTDVYRPTGEGNFPVLLVRTPYNNDGFAAFGRRGAARGFMVVAQDVRGRYA